MSGRSLMRKRIAIAVVVVGMCGLVGVVVVRGQKADAIVSVVPLDYPPTDVTVDARSGHAVVTGQPEAIVAAQLGTIRTWVLDPRDGHVTMTRVAPNPLYVCHGYVLDHWPNMGPLTTPCARAVMASTPQDPVTHRAFLTGVEAVVVVDPRTGAPIAPQVDVFSQPQVPVVNEQIHRAYVPIGGDHAGGHAMWIWDTRTGRLLSVVGFQGSPSVPVVDARTNRVFVPVYDDLVPSSANRIVTLDARTGRILRTVALEQGLFVIWSGVTAGTVHVFAVDTRRVGGISSPNVLGTAFMLDARQGAIMHRVDVGLNPLMGAVDDRRGLVYILNLGPEGITADTTYRDAMYRYLPVGAGSVSVLDAASGRLLRTIPVGVDPHGLAVDERTGHVIVVAGGGTIDVPDADPWAWAPGWLRQRLPFMTRSGHHWRHIKPTVTVLDATN